MCRRDAYGVGVSAQVGDLEALGRICLAALLGFVVGWERRLRGHSAGDRTFALACVGAAAFTVAAVPFPDDAGKVIAGIVTGVGFIGGGLVFRPQTGKDVHGLTTAVGLWAMVAVGVLAGIGRLVLASGTTVVVVVLLELQQLPVLQLLDADRFMERRGQPNKDEPDDSV